MLLALHRAEQVMLIPAAYTGQIENNTKLLANTTIVGFCVALLLGGLVVCQVLNNKVNNDKFSEES